MSSSHQSLEITHPCFQNLWYTASKPEAPRIYMEHHDPANTHSFETHIGSKNDRSPFLPIGEDATPAFPIEPAFPIAPSSHSYTA